MTNGKKIRRTEITIETHSITIIRTNAARNSVHCEQCCETVTAFAPEQVAAALRFDLAEVCRRVETKQLHLTNNKSGTALICGNSFKNDDSFGESKISLREK